MSKALTDFDVNLLLVLIILMLYKSIYNIYILHIYSKEHKNSIREILTSDNEFLGYKIATFFIIVTYLFSSIYFILYNKVKTLLFGLFVAYMLWRVLGYSVTVLGVDIFFLDRSDEDVFIYRNILVVSILTILFTMYLIRIIYG
jgi:hypothetical protein